MEPVIPPGVDPRGVLEKPGFGLRLGGPSVSMNQLFSLANRTIIITGGAGSLGVNVASAVLESGADAVCIDRAAEPLPEMWKRLQAIAESHSGKVSYYSCDTTDSGNVDQVFTEAKKQSRKPIRGLVACAGIAYDIAAIDNDMTRSLRVFEVNINGTIACAQATARIMQDHGESGSMVFIASMSAHGANKGLDTAAYNSSKAAVVQLGRSLASEWGSREGMPQIRVNTISPGYIKTVLLATHLLVPGNEEQWSSENMLNRLSYPDEYRGPAIFLLSDASSFVTGADLRVDAGHMAW